eukprot:371707-Amphidinium_carterae.1
MPPTWHTDQPSSCPAIDAPATGSLLPLAKQHEPPPWYRRSAQGVHSKAHAIGVHELPASTWFHLVPDEEG